MSRDGQHRRGEPPFFLLHEIRGSEPHQLGVFKTIEDAMTGALKISAELTEWQHEEGDHTMWAESSDGRFYTITAARRVLIS